VRTVHFSIKIPAQSKKAIAKWKKLIEQRGHATPGELRKYGETTITLFKTYKFGSGALTAPSVYRRKSKKRAA
jgi:hypothetical protein